MTITERLNKIRDLLSKSEMRAAIAELEELPGGGKLLTDNLPVIKGRLASLEEKIREDTIDNDQQTITENKIRGSLLRLTGEVEERLNKQQESRSTLVVLADLVDAGNAAIPAPQGDGSPKPPSLFELLRDWGGIGVDPARDEELEKNLRRIRESQDPRVQEAAEVAFLSLFEESMPPGGSDRRGAEEFWTWWKRVPSHMFWSVLIIVALTMVSGAAVPFLRAAYGPPSDASGPSGETASATTDEDDHGLSAMATYSPISSFGLNMLFAAGVALFTWRRAARTPRGRDNRSRTARKTQSRFRHRWIYLWWSWVIFYGFLAAKIVVAEQVAEESQSTVTWLFPWMAGWANSLQTLLFLALWYELQEPTVNLEDQQSDRDFPWARASLIFVSFHLLELWVCAGQGEVDATGLLSPWNAFQLVNGVACACALALVVGRLDSKFLGAPTHLITVIYIYVAIQPLYFLLDEDGRGKSTLLVIQCLTAILALFGKLALALYLYWAMRHGRLLYYMREVRSLHEHVGRDWLAFYRRGLDDLPDEAAPQGGDREPAP
ncbi:MAG: hypothetical protein H6719_08650 [Sandaracinaceae bacterium]|nr:hypothetical protein [Sandaracinaceae bacterium]